MTLILATLFAVAAAPNAIAPQEAASAAKSGMIKASTPADGAMLQGSPPRFEVTFVQAMTLKAVTITDTDDNETVVTARPEAVDAASARIALPQLAPGTYKLRWFGVARSGQETSGDLSFMVH